MRELSIGAAFFLHKILEDTWGKSQQLEETMSIPNSI
jgi:hypothetical protein